MTDIAMPGMWEMNVAKTIRITKAGTKDAIRIIEYFNKYGSKLDPNIKEDRDYIESLIIKLKNMGWIEETKDAYILTEKGKENVERYRNRRL